MGPSTIRIDRCGLRRRTNTDHVEHERHNAESTQNPPRSAGGPATSNRFEPIISALPAPRSIRRSRRSGRRRGRRSSVRPLALADRCVPIGPDDGEGDDVVVERPHHDEPDRSPTAGGGRRSPHRGGVHESADRISKRGLRQRPTARVRPQPRYIACALASVRPASRTVSVPR